MEKKPKSKEKSLDLMGKIEAAKEMRDLASSMMKDSLGGKMKSLKEVKVASDSSEGLKKGLEKAKEMVNKKAEIMPEEDHEEEIAQGEESPEEESSEEEMESPEEEYADVLEMCDSPEKIDKLIAKLEEKKAELLKA